MKRWIIFLLFINLTVLVADAQKVAPLIDSAKNAYAEQNYEKAIGFYEKVLDKDLESAELYYNLGNAYYKLHDMASAILNYERAK
ncbi:MAG: tetratricopeptide repeat protein, partial [Bacteroidota bacterium]